MGEPVERMRKFVEDRQQRERWETAKAVWSQRVAELLPRIEAVVEVVGSALAPEQFQGPAVSVLVDPRRDLFPLVIAFAPRVLKEGPMKLRAGLSETETGASAVFRCEADGKVYGFRYPFHGLTKSLPPERFVELGAPACVGADDIGNAAADFLEWATVGGGCGGSKLDFGPPATLPFVTAGVKQPVIAA